MAVGNTERQLGHDVVLPLPCGHHAAAVASQPASVPAVPPRDEVASGLFDITRFEADLGAVDFAIDLVVTVDEADILGLGAAFERAGAAAKFEIFDEDDGIAIG